MALVWRTSLLSLQPAVAREGEVLHARTPALLRVLALGSYERHVEVDATTRYVHIDVRWLYRFHDRRTVPFAHVDHVAYEFSALPTGWDRFGRTNQLERFAVALVLASGEKVHLVTFRGDGSVDDHPFRFAQIAGTQESTSRWYVDQLCELLGVGIGPKVAPVRDASGKTWACTRCRRPSPPRPGKCLYCGAPTASAEAAVDVAGPRGAGHPADRASRPSAPSSSSSANDPAAEALRRWNEERDR